MGYATDEWGMNRSLGLIDDPNGNIIKYDDFKAFEDLVKFTLGEDRFKQVTEELDMP